MSGKEEQIVQHVCSSFEGQTWRKSLCKNCFHTLNEHSEELLSQEAIAVAKEKAAVAAQPSFKPTLLKSDLQKGKSAPTMEGKNGKVTKAEKEKSPKDIKVKTGAAKDVIKDDSKVSKVKEIVLENGKSLKPSIQTTLKTKTPTTSSSSTSSPTISPTKSPLKSVTTSSPTISPTKSPPKSETTSPPSTATTSVPSSTSSAVTNPKKSDVSDAISPANAAKTPVSKTKNFASKFESKTSAVLPKDKLSKPPDTRPSSLNTVASNGKCAADSFEAKSSVKQQPDKLYDIKSSPLKLDSKTSRKVTEESKLSDATSKSSKPELTKINGNKVTCNKDDKNNSKDGSEKKSALLSNKNENKDSPSSVFRPKTGIFGRDILKNAKDAIKQARSSPEAGDDKKKSAQSKDERTMKGSQSLKAGSSKNSTITGSDTDKANTISKSSAGKGSENKTKQQENQSVLKTSTEVKDPDISQGTNSDSKLATAIVNKPGYLGKIAGKSSDIKANVNSESNNTSKVFKCRDKKESSPVSDLSKMASDKTSREKERKERSVAETTKDTVASSIEDKQATSPATPCSSSKNITPLSTTPPTDAKSSSSAADTKSLKTLKLDTGRESKSVPSSLEKFKGLEKTKDNAGDKQTLLSPIISPPSYLSQTSRKRDESNDKPKEEAMKKDTLKLKEELKEKEEKLATLSKKLSNMEDQARALAEEKGQITKSSLQNQKKDTEKMLNDLRGQLSEMESQCDRLEKDNQALIDKLHTQEATVKLDQETRGKNSQNVNLEEDLEVAEKELEEVKGINKELQCQIMEMKNEMEEMYDHFRETEHEEFRELQKELDITAKNCRILQFKLRKAERCNDQIEEDRIHYEEKLRMLQDQFDSKDAKNHIRVLEEELRVAKEVSVRLHDELDIVEDKRNKALEDNRHLTELLEHTDRRQFRLEMEIDKLRDSVADLKQQLKEAKSGNNNNNNNNKESSPDRKVHSTIYTRSID